MPHPRPSYIRRPVRELGAAAPLLGVAMLALVAVAPRPSHAQATPPLVATSAAPTDGPYGRARHLVRAGRGEAGRALADSLVAAAADGSPVRAEALWWRATLARDAAAAEQDYRRLTDAYPHSPRAGDALLRLAQLQLVAERRDSARVLLVRALGGAPDDAARARAHYWTARVRLEAGDAVGACASLGAAAAARASDEVRRQVDALRPRVDGCAPAVATATGVPAPPSPLPTSRPRTVRAPGFTVQVAAYDDRPDAEASAAGLAARGLAARVVGTAAPFRVRVGRHATRAEAAAALRALRGRGVTGFVTEAEPAVSTEARP